MKAILFLILFLAGVPGIGAHYHPDILESIAGKVKKMVKQAGQPVAVFDIDDTLVSTPYRTQRILSELGEIGRFSARHPIAAERLRNIPIHRVHYELKDTLRSIGFDNSQLLEAVTQFWGPRFFSSEYVENDRIIPGASTYVSRLHELGAKVVYLTGRDAPRMGEGTRRSLRRRGFPMDEDAVILMKPHKEIEDLIFKKQAVAWIAEQGSVVAVFENEPANLNLLGDSFPDAHRVFVDTIHSNKADLPALESVWIRDYKMENE
jgi:hypothetical protein